MSRLNDLIRQVAAKRPDARRRTSQREVDALADRRAFGLNFERHIPEAVELPGRPVRKGDKVRVLPPRGETPKADERRLWRVVESIDRDAETATVGRRRRDGRRPRRADVAARRPRRRRRVPRPDLPGPRLHRQGRARRRQAVPHGHQRRELPRAPDAAVHPPRQGRLHLHRPAVQHRREGLEVQQRLRRGRRPLPPLKWLAFMERRLLLAKELLNPDDSVLIVTIDEKEYLRLGLLLEQTFPEARHSDGHDRHQPAGVARATASSRESTSTSSSCCFGDAGDPLAESTTCCDATGRTASAASVALAAAACGAEHDARRATRPNLFYPVFVDAQTARIVRVGEPLPLGRRPRSVSCPDGHGRCAGRFGPTARRDAGGITPRRCARTLAAGLRASSAVQAEQRSTYAIYYLTSGDIETIDSGEYRGRRARCRRTGLSIARRRRARRVDPEDACGTMPSHDAERVRHRAARKLAARIAGSRSRSRSTPSRMRFASSSPTSRTPSSSTSSPARARPRTP